MFDRFVFIAGLATVCTLFAGWSYELVRAAETARYGTTTLEHIR